MPAGRVTNDPSNYFAVGIQSAKDVEATTFYFTKHLDGTGYDVEPEIASERIGGGGKEVALRYKTGIKADGQLVQYGWPDGTGRTLAWTGLIDGAQTNQYAATTSGALTLHFLHSGGTQLSYLTIDQAWADNVERTSNGVITDLKLELQAGHPFKYTLQFISAGTPRVATQALVPVREGGGPYMVPGASAVIEVHGGAEGAPANATSSELTKASIEIKNTVDEAIRTLQLQRNDVTWENVDYTVTGTLKYTDAKVWRQVQFAGGSLGNFAFLATGAVTLFSRPLFPAQASNSLELVFPMLEFSDAKVNRLDPDGKTMYLDFTSMNVANATYSFYANVITGATASYNLSTT